MSPRQPERFPRVVEDHDPVAAEDMRPWATRNAKALGTIIGTAIATLLVGTGGLTGLAHVAGIATTKQTDAIDAKIAAVEQHQQTSATVDAERFKKQDAKLDSLLKAVTGLRADVAKKIKKPKATEPDRGSSE